MIDRRNFLRAAAYGTAGLAATGFSPDALAQVGLNFGPASPFSFDRLKEDVRRRAASAFILSHRPNPDLLEKIDYDEHGRIKYRSDLALWANGPGLFPLTFFHLGRFFPEPVRMSVVEGGLAREVLYDAAYFDIPENSPARQLSKNAGFAGFRFQERRDGGLDWKTNDWVAFLGASYFRAIGEHHQYGISARGVAIDTALTHRPEEFPDFIQFWLDTPEAGSDTVIVHALLDGPSIAGAYRFAMKRDERVTIDVDSLVVPRRDVARLGIAPLTSMYWFSETAKPTMADWRPEVHDSDGLALWSGTGERIWRPLNNPPRSQVSTFTDRTPHGFGLLQRDRDFNHYLDGVHYERRPSLWVEPKGDWGEGAVLLLENPTSDESQDNIAAMWVPGSPAMAGRELGFAYRTVWAADHPEPNPLARCVATRIGNPEPSARRRSSGKHRIVVEFLGTPLGELPVKTPPEAVIGMSRGSFTKPRSEKVPSGAAGHWRISFDIEAEGQEPVDIRCFLRVGGEGGRVLSETWLYQYHPAE